MVNPKQTTNNYWSCEDCNTKYPLRLDAEDCCSEHGVYTTDEEVKKQ